MGFLIGLLLQILFYMLTNKILLEHILIIILTIYGIRFLSGIGIFSTYLMICSELLKRLSPYMKRKRQAARRLVLTLKILGVFIFMALVIIVTLSIIIMEGVGYVSLFIGVAVSIMTLYIIPIWKEDRTFKPEETFLTKIKGMLGSLYLKIKKGYYKYFTGDYLKAYSIEYLLYRTRLDEFRYKLAFWLLPLLVISTTPLLILTIPLWVILPRILAKREITAVDKFLITAAGGFSLIYLTYKAYVDLTIPSLVLHWNIPYIIGLAISFFIFLRAMFFK